MPDHFKRLSCIIDRLPADLSFELSQQSELEFQDTGLSQKVEILLCRSQMLPRRPCWEETVKRVALEAKTQHLIPLYLNRLARSGN